MFYSNIFTKFGGHEKTNRLKPAKHLVVKVKPLTDNQSFIEMSFETLEKQLNGKNNTRRDR